MATKKSKQIEHDDYDFSKMHKDVCLEEIDRLRGKLRASDILLAEEQAAVEIADSTIKDLREEMNYDRINMAKLNKIITDNEVAGEKVDDILKTVQENYQQLQDTYDSLTTKLKIQGQDEDPFACVDKFEDALDKVSTLNKRCQDFTEERIRREAYIETLKSGIQTLQTFRNEVMNLVVDENTVSIDNQGLLLEVLAHSEKALKWDIEAARQREWWK